MYNTHVKDGNKRTADSSLEDTTAQWVGRLQTRVVFSISGSD